MPNLIQIGGSREYFGRFFGDFMCNDLSADVIVYSVKTCKVDYL